MMDELNGLVAAANGDSDGMERLYEHLSDKIDWVRTHPKLFEVSRTKLLNLVAIDGWKPGRRFYDAFGINSISESFFIIKMSTESKKRGSNLHCR